MGFESIHAGLLEISYNGYLGLLHLGLLRCRSEGAFELANLYEEIIHQWSNLNIVSFGHFPGLLSSYLEEKACRSSSPLISQGPDSV